MTFPGISSTNLPCISSFKHIHKETNYEKMKIKLLYLTIVQYKYWFSKTVLSFYGLLKLIKQTVL
jgi:hypothetical protein